MNLLKTIKKNLAIRFQYLIRKREQKNHTQSIIKKYNLNDPIEQKIIITHHNLICEGKGGFGRKYKALVQDKINFMIRYELIKVKL